MQRASPSVVDCCSVPWQTGRDGKFLLRSGFERYSKILELRLYSIRALRTGRLRRWLGKALEGIEVER